MPSSIHRLSALVTGSVTQSPRPASARFVHFLGPALIDDARGFLLASGFHSVCFKVLGHAVTQTIIRALWTFDCGLKG